jgi:hypothetical protein
MRRLFISLLAASAGPLLLSGTGTVQAAAADDYTGCLTPGGTLIHVAKGASPAKPCSKKQQVVHLDGRVAKQTYELHWKPAVVCEALRALDTGNGNADIDSQLTALGCPSTAVTMPGTKLVGPIDSLAFSFTDADGNPDALGCGILKIEKRPEWGIGYHWVVDGGATQDPQGPAGGYVAKEVVYNTVPDGAGECATLCENDDKCIAATYPGGLGSASGGNAFRTCRTFHYSDNAGSQTWHDLCGFAESGLGSCANNANLTVNQWWIRDCSASAP